MGTRESGAFLFGIYELYKDIALSTRRKPCREHEITEILSIFYEKFLIKLRILLENERKRSRDMKKRVLKVLAVTIIAICSFLLVACNSENYKSGGLKKTTAVAPIVYDVSEKESAVEKAATVDLSALSKEVNADGATVLSNDVTTITSAGSYILTGAYAGITVSVGNGETAHLFLNNATISGGAGIAISNTNKKSTLIITACENTENEVASKGDDVNAIHVKGTLKINGTGTIKVSAKKNGIKVSKGLSIADSTINLTAGNHALSARFIEAENAKINVLSAGKDALNAECDDETQEFTLDEGYVSLKSSKVFASVSGDGIQADTFVYITGGSVDIKTAATFVSYSAESMATYDLSEDDFRYTKSGDTYKKIDDVASNGARYAMIQSAKGIKCGEIKYEIDGTEYAVTKNSNYFIVIDGARVKINSSDDAIHTNSGNVLIKGGTLDLTTLDDGIHADELVKIDGGEITVNGSYEGIEGAYVEIGGGTIYITASDDGINAASDDESVNEHIIISGGTITVDASGDGLDSNGTIYVSGGTLIVYGPTTGADTGLDADGGILIDGGNVFVASSKEMLEIPASNSKSNVLVYGVNTVAAGSEIILTNADGGEMVRITLKKQAQAIILSTPELATNGTYSLYADENLLASFSVTETITAIGVQSNGGRGGQPAQPGGAQPGGQGGNPPAPRN